MICISVFSGIGGFELGLEPLGFEFVLQVENNPFCVRILEKDWPHVRRIGDIRDAIRERNIPSPIKLICGGDPCQANSLAKGGKLSQYPAMAGYFLAMVGRCQAEWVLRENVCSPTVKHFAFALQLMGYGTVIVELNARDFTSQHRRRQFVIGGPGDKCARLREILLDTTRDRGICPEGDGEGQAYAQCITTHPSRISESDTLIYEHQKRNLRFLTEGEAERLQGFSGKRTAGFSRTRHFITVGNAVPPPMVAWIGERIMEVENDD